MSEMVERVAKAIFEADQSGLPERVQRRPFDDLDEASGVAVRYRTIARSAIAAMEPPTQDMVDRATKPEFDRPANQVLHTWTLMIAEALK